MAWTLKDFRASRKRHLNLAQRYRALQHKYGRKANRQRELAAKRAKQIESRKPAANLKAVAWVHRQVANGVCEHPPGSNRGPEVDAWNRASGIAPGPAAYWCQSFANASLIAAGGPQIHSAYTPAVVQWARQGSYGLKLVSYADRRPGDWEYFKFPGVSRDFCDHVGVVLENVNETGEGNTSPGSGGSQNNGGVCAIHSRGAAYVVAVVRPPYPTKKG